MAYKSRSKPSTAEHEAELNAKPDFRNRLSSIDSRELADQDILMDSRGCAAYLGISPLSLSDWRTKGIGIKYIKVGRCVRYRMSDIQAYLNSRRK